MAEWKFNTTNLTFGNDLGDSLEHHGILGMKWGVRRFQNKDGSLTSAGKNRYVTNEDGDISTIHRDKPTPRKKKVTEGNGKGAHKRGEGENLMDAAGEFGVGGWNSYHNAVNVYGSWGVGQAPVSRQLGEALKTAILQETLKTEEYRNIQKLIKEIEKLAEERKKTWNQGSTATTMVFEEKANKLIRDINTNLGNLDDKYREKTKLVKQTVNKTYSPSKDVLDFLSLSSNALKIDKNGRVSKGWKTSPTTPNNTTGWKL